MIKTNKKSHSLSDNKSCKPKIYELDEEDRQGLLMIANNIILNFDQVKDNTAKLNQIIKQHHIQFSFGRRDKTKYGDRALKSLFTLRNLCRAVIIGLSTHYLCTQDVYKLISEKYQTYSSLDEIAKLTSVGYLIDGYPATHPVNVTINLIGFGLTTMSDWQYYLMTPLGASMFQDLLNKDPKAFLKMLASASLMGVGSKDILFNLVPKLHIKICNNQYKQFVNIIEKLEDVTVEFVINKAVVLGLHYSINTLFNN